MKPEEIPQAWMEAAWDALIAPGGGMREAIAAYLELAERARDQLRADGERLRVARDEHGLSRARHAALAGVSARTIYNAETGARTSRDTRDRLAAVLGLPTEAIFQDAEAAGVDPPLTAPFRPRSHPKTPPERKPSKKDLELRAARQTIADLREQVKQLRAILDDRLDEERP